MITGQSIPSRLRSVLDYKLLDELVIYDPVSAKVAALNSSAGAIWELCDGSRSVDAICKEVAEHFGVSLEEVSMHVRVAVERLHELGLLCV
jgi:PqqD family protein of HPr-rel-A system